jgi:hypothetical protein
MAISDQDLLIKQYKSIGDDVPADFVDNKVQILACAMLPEVEEESKKLPQEQVIAGISDYIMLRPKNDVIFSKILKVEYMLKHEDKMSEVERTALPT